MGLSPDDEIEHIFREEKAQEDIVTMGRESHIQQIKQSTFSPHISKELWATETLGTAVGKC